MLRGPGISVHWCSFSFEIATEGTILSFMAELIRIGKAIAIANRIAPQPIDHPPQQQVDHLDLNILIIY